MRVDLVLVAAAAVIGGGFACVAPLATAVAAGAAAVTMGLWRRPWAFGLVALAVAVGALRASRAVDAFEAERVALRDALGPPKRCALWGEVITSPARRGDSLAYDVTASRIECETGALPVPTRVRLYGGPSDLARGDRLSAVTQLGPVRLFRNTELPDPTPGAARRGAVLSGGALSVEVVRRARGPRALVDRARAHARERIEATFTEAAAPMARALVLGENDLDPDEDEAFRRSGLAHLLAVSGTHLVFAIVSLVKLLEAVAVRVPALAARMDARRLPALLGAVLSIAYADFAGGSGSAWRAAWMLAVALGARGAGRRPSLPRSFALSLGVGWALDPLVAFDLSFLLSAAATSGLVVIAQPATRALGAVRLRALRYAGAAVAATVASMIPCAPLLALLGPSLTLAGIIANVVAAPLGEIVALPLCLAHPLMTWLPALESGTALVASGALRVVANVAFASASATWSAVPVPPPGPWHFVVIAAGAAWVLSARTAHRRLFGGLVALLGLAVVEGAAIRAGRPIGLLRVTALDVGQGDATLVDLPDGSLLLIDGGGFVGSPVDPGERVILPLLRKRRRDRVDVAVLSHPHPDHFGGLATALRHIEVGEFWDSGQGAAEGAGPVYAEMLRSLRERRVPVRGPRDLCGRDRMHGGARLRVFGPCPDFSPGLDANDNSLVIHIRFGERAALLTGDAELHQETTLIGQHGDRLRADFLKVGHHGSRTSTSPEFLEHVQPRLATISCGVRNRYGHPHDVTLETLSKAGARAFRLDRSGSVTFKTDGRHVALQTYSDD